MNIEDFSTKVLDLIGNNKFNDAIKLMRQLLNESNHLNEVLAQSGRYMELERQERLGIVNYENATVEKNKIRFALLGLVEEIRESVSENTTIRREFEQINPQKLYMVIEPPKAFKWMLFVVIPLILCVFGFIGWKAYQMFYPKCDEPIDNKRCWVKTKPVFSDLMSEPSFSPQNIMTELPGSKKYHVLEIATVEMDMKCYKIEDKKLGKTGWVREQQLAEINDVCFKEQQTTTAIDKTKCWLKTGHFAHIYYEADVTQQSFAQIEAQTEYAVLDSKSDQGMNFFMVRDEKRNIEGWLKQQGLEFVSPICL